MGVILMTVQCRAWRLEGALGRSQDDRALWAAFALTRRAMRRAGRRRSQHVLTRTSESMSPSAHSRTSCHARETITDRELCSHQRRLCFPPSTLLVGKSSDSVRSMPASAYMALRARTSSRRTKRVAVMRRRGMPHECPSRRCGLIAQRFASQTPMTGTPPLAPVVAMASSATR